MSPPLDDECHYQIGDPIARAPIDDRLTSASFVNADSRLRDEGLAASRTHLAVRL
jgi:hypothetical protein